MGRGIGDIGLVVQRVFHQIGMAGPVQAGNRQVQIAGAHTLPDIGDTSADLYFESHLRRFLLKQVVRRRHQIEYQSTTSTNTQVTRVPAGEVDGLTLNIIHGQPRR